MALTRTKAFVVRLAVFTMLGWLLAAILDVIGVFQLSDALVVAGLLMGVVAGLAAFQSGDRPLMRGASPILNMPLVVGVGTGVTPSAARVFAVVGACVAAVGLIAAGVFLG